MNFSFLFNNRRRWLPLAGFALVTLLLLGWAGIAGAAEGAKPAAAAAAAGAEAAGHGHGDGHVGFVRQISFSYLTAFMFFFCIVVGALFMTILHHLFDAGWSVPVRRILEQTAALMPYVGLLFLPILANVWLADDANKIYTWMTVPPDSDPAIKVKKVLLNRESFTVLSLVLFGIWSYLALALRRFSIAQDADGAAVWTRKMRNRAAWGIFVLALSSTLGVILWMMSLQHQFFSTIYGVIFFANSMWLTAITTYVVANWLKHKGPLAAVVHRRQFYDLGVVFFAFTVFYAYVTFSQYFLIWNGAMPEETFWYVRREQGSWWWVGMLIIFGKFFAPFLTLLRIDAKLNPRLMQVMGGWAWLCVYMDMQYNIMPAVYPGGLSLGFSDLISLALIGGVLVTVWKKNYFASAPYPLKDPRLGEALSEAIHAREHAASH